jgi:hypothetical protein
LASAGVQLALDITVAVKTDFARVADVGDRSRIPIVLAME